MSYVKISDPAIIDIGAWHQLIQVVNQYGDAISSITNNFGSSLAITNTDGDNWHSTFDLGSQLINFGRATIVGVPYQDSDPDADVVLYENAASIPALTYRPFILKETNVAFPLSFSAKPVVIGTLQTNLAARTEYKVTIGNVTNNDFSITVSGFDKTAAERTVTVNWIAIGPK